MLNEHYPPTAYNFSQFYTIRLPSHSALDFEFSFAQSCICGVALFVWLRALRYALAQRR